MQIKHTFLFTFLLGLVWTGYLFAFSTGPDPGSNGITGDAAACSTSGCHSGNPVNAAPGSMSIDGLPAAWTPGQTYPLTITVQRPGQGRFGFQLSAVVDETMQQAGTLAPGNSRVSIRTSAGIQFAQHNNATSASTFNVNWTAPASATAGTVRFNLAGNAANADFSPVGDFIYTRVDRIAPAGAPTGETVSFYYPHVANGVLGGSTVWKTTIFLTNPASSGTASGSITFTKDNPTFGSAGSAFTSISFVDENGASAGGGGTIPFSIAPGETRKYTSDGAGEYAGGFAKVSSSAALDGTAIFSQFTATGRLVAEAGVPAGAAVGRQAIFVDTVGGYNIGVAYANPGTAAATVTLSLMNSSGGLVATSTQTLGPGNHRAAFVSEMFPGSPPMVGTLQITSATPLVAIALRFDPTFSVFTTLPPVPIF
jgi:hypothetical protein